MPTRFERWLYRGVKLPMGMIAVGIACALLLGVKENSRADVCDDVIDLLGLGDTTFIVCPVPNVLVIQLVPGGTDTLVVTEDGDTLSWPLDTGMLPPEDEWIPHTVFGLAGNQDYLFLWDGLPFDIEHSSPAGGIRSARPVSGSVSWKRVRFI